MIQILIQTYVIPFNYFITSYSSLLLYFPPISIGKSFDCDKFQISVYLVIPLQKIIKCFLPVWLDVRTSKIVDDLLKNKGAQSINAVTQTSGLPLSTYFSSVKLKWLLQNVTSIKDALAAGECMAGTVDSWLIWVTHFTINVPAY